MGKRATDEWAARHGAEVRRDVGAEVLTTFRGGGLAERVYLPRSAEDAAELIGLCRAEGDEPYVLGGGSKTVVADGEVMLPVVSTALMRAVEVVGMSDEGVTVRAECGARLSDVARRAAAECGARLSDVARRAADCGCGGLEFLAGVPASVGGAVHMNAGAFGQQTADHIVEIEVLNPVLCEIERKSRAQTDFGYRRGAEGFVCAVTFFLPVMSGEERASRRERFLAWRRSRQPRLPSCGSVFKRGSAMRGLKACGWAGRRSRGCMRASSSTREGLPQPIFSRWRSLRQGGWKSCSGRDCKKNSKFLRMTCHSDKTYGIMFYHRPRERVR